jgi:hypothetical protein
MSARPDLWLVNGAAGAALGRAARNGRANFVQPTSARTSPHNTLFLRGSWATLTADPGWNGEWFTNVLRGLRARTRLVLALSQRSIATNSGD